jgi:hypothetical protein
MRVSPTEGLLYSRGSIEGRKVRGEFVPPDAELVMVVKLDRLGRSTRDGPDLVHQA